MKQTTKILGGLGLWFIQVIGAGAVTVNSHISEVTVYPDRARVTRLGEIVLRKGENIVEMTGLPVGLDDNSVRISGDPIPGVRVDSLEVRPVEALAAEVDTKPLELRIETANDTLRAVRDDIAEVQRRREYLESLREKMSQTVAVGGSRTNLITAVNVKSYYDLYGAESRQLTEKTRTLEIQQRTLSRDIEKQQQELAKLQRGQPVTTKKALVVMRSDRDVTGKLQVSYLMGGASWQPLYDVRGEPGSGKLNLTYSANVSQQTGENWDNVRMTLSTARPNVGARLPDFTPWVVRVASIVSPAAPTMLGELRQAGRNEAQKQMRDFKSDRDQRLAAVNGIAPDQEQSASSANVDSVQQKMKWATAEVQSLGATAVFRVPAEATVPGDGRPRRSTIALIELDGNPEYVAAPRLASGAFQKAKVKNVGAQPLLPGEISLFMGDDFIGRSALRFVAPNAMFELFLGQDDGVKVTRKEVKKRQEDSGLIRKKQLSVRGYEIEVVNFKDKPAKVTVTEAIPVAEQSVLTVKADWNGNTPTKYDADQGQAEWTMELKPQEKRIIRYGFEVESEVGTVIENL